MNRPPPIARLSTSRVFGAVCPMYCPTRSSRVTATRCPLRTYPSRCNSDAIFIATVVLPVPGRLVGCVGLDRVALYPALRLDATQPEPRLVSGPVHQE